MHRGLHLFFELAAFAVAYRYYLWLRKRQSDPIPDGQRLWIIIGAAAGALLGSRLLGALEDPAALSGGWRSFVVALNNRTIVGGLLGGLAGVELVKRAIGEKRRSGDLFVYPLLLGMIIGRMGCALAGLEDHTYGTVTALPWGMDLGDGLRRHPTNVYEILFLCALWLLLRWVQHRWMLAAGALFQLFMVGYLAFRSLIETLKPDPIVWAGLSSIQLACVAGLLYYYRVWLRPSTLIIRSNG